MKSTYCLITSLLFFLSFKGICQQDDKGLVTVSSKFTVKETADRFVETISSKGFTVFARIDHASNAVKQGLQLRPTELVIFGNPKAGTMLMQADQLAGIDLPLKVLVWEDENGNAWLTYNDPKWISERHNLSAKTPDVIKGMEEGIKALVSAAVSQ